MFFYLRGLSNEINKQKPLTNSKTFKGKDNNFDTSQQKYCKTSNNVKMLSFYRYLFTHLFILNSIHFLFPGLSPLSTDNTQIKFKCHSFKNKTNKKSFTNINTIQLLSKFKTCKVFLKSLIPLLCSHFSEFKNIKKAAKFHQNTYKLKQHRYDISELCFNDKQ